MGLQTCNDKGPHLLLRAGSLAAGGEVTVNGIPNRLIYCLTLILRTQSNECSCRPRNTTWLSAGWRPVV